MPQIDLPPNFDFSEDAQKQNLTTTLERFSSAITTLQRRADEAESERRLVTLFPSELAPSLDFLGAGSTNGPLLACGFDGGSMFGSWSANGAIDVVEESSYQRDGSETYRPAFSLGHDLGNTLTVTLEGILPQNIRGWSVAGIQWDINTSTGATTPSFQLQAIFGNTSLGGMTVTANSSSQSINWQTLTIKGEDLNEEGFSRQPGTRFRLQLTMSSIGASSITHQVGTIRLNWK